MANERQFTLDDLAAMVAQGFGDLRGQASGLRSDVAGLKREVEKRFDRTERDLAEVKYLLTDVVRRDAFLDLKQRVDVVERHIGLRPKDGSER